MSRSYTAIKSRFMSENDQSFEEILDELAAIDPEMAQRFQELDWDGILTEVTRQAMEQAARECECSVSSSYEGHYHASRERHYKRYERNMGSLYGGGQRGNRGPELGVFLVDNRIVLYWDREEEMTHSTTLEQWKSVLQRCYIECAMAAVLHLIKEPDATVTRQEVGDSSVMFETTIARG